MGMQHLKAIAKSDCINIRCVCDVDEKRALSFKNTYNADCHTTDAYSAISDPDTDIVIIATYPSSHPELVELCVKFGKHMILEKPIAQNMESGKKIIELIKNNPQCKMLVGYILRHNDTYKKVADMIHGGAIGFPIVMRMVQNHKADDWEKYKRLILETSPIVDCGVHYADVMRWFTGAEIEDVSGVGLCSEPDLPKGKYNYGIMTVRLTDGSVGYYEAGWGRAIKTDFFKEFIGPKGRIRITYCTLRKEDADKGNLIEYYSYEDDKEEQINVAYTEKPTLIQLMALIDMIENDAVYHPTVDDVWQSFSNTLKADKIISDSLK